MTDDAAPLRWPTNRVGLSFLAVLSALVATVVVLTQLNYVVLAVVLAYVLNPAQQYLERRMSAGYAALTLTALSVLVLFLLVGYVVAIAIQQGIALYEAIRAGAFRPDLIQDRMAAVGYVVDLDLLYATYREPIAAGTERLTTGAMTAIGGLPGLFVGLTVTTFVLFVLLRDGHRLLAWLQSVVPIADPVQRDLLAELDELMWASVVGNVAVAGIQAVFLGAAFLIIGMPGIVFLTLATFILCLLPLVGAFGVWIPVGVYLLGVARPEAALAIVAVGVFVSVLDNYLRPAIINRSGALNIAVITVGIFGGIVIFGVGGLFVGPVVLGGTKVVLDEYARERAGQIPE